jgi:hypothetical protein
MFDNIQSLPIEPYYQLPKALQIATCHPELICTVTQPTNITTDFHPKISLLELARTSQEWSSIVTLTTVSDTQHLISTNQPAKQPTTPHQTRQTPSHPFNRTTFTHLRIHTTAATASYNPTPHLIQPNNPSLTPLRTTSTAHTASFAPSNHIRVHNFETTYYAATT